LIHSPSGGATKNRHRSISWSTSIDEVIVSDTEGPAWRNVSGAGVDTLDPHPDIAIMKTSAIRRMGGIPSKRRTVEL
jgi:hypothetical protein